MLKYSVHASLYVRNSKIHRDLQTVDQIITKCTKRHKQRLVQDVKVDNTDIHKAQKDKTLWAAEIKTELIEALANETMVF